MLLPQRNQPLLSEMYDYLYTLDTTPHVRR